MPTNSPATDIRDLLPTARERDTENKAAHISHLSAKVFRPVKLPLFGDWQGLRKPGIRDWFSDPSLINPQVAELVMRPGELSVRMPNSDLQVNAVDLSASFVVAFTRHDYGNGTSEVNAWIHHPSRTSPRIGFKTIWPTAMVRPELAKAHEVLPILSPFAVQGLLTKLKEASELYGVGWNIFHRARVDHTTLQSLRYEGEPATCPGCWQQRLTNPEARGPLDCPLHHH